MPSFRQPWAKSAPLALLLGAGVASWAGTVLELPETVEHRTRLNLDIRGTRWAVNGKCFSGMVEATNQASRDTRLEVVVSGAGRYRKAVPVPAGQTVRFPVHVPVFTEDGKRGWMPQSQVTFRQDGDSETYRWADYNDYGYSGDVPLIRPRNGADLPADPRHYWPLTTISLTPEQWSRLDAPRRDALLAWVEQGGTLHVPSMTGADALLAEIRRTRPPSGLVQRPGGTGAPYGMGGILLGEMPEQGVTPPYLDAALALAPSWPVATISRWLLIPLVALFAVLIGPVTIWHCHRRKRPALALLLIPSVSLCACLSILLVSLLHDGVTPKVCRQTLTCLDQRDGTATTAQVLGIEAPLGLFGPVVFPEEALVLLAPGDTASPRATVSGAELHIRGAVLARTPTFFATLHRERRRERLDVRRDADTVRVVNGLGAPVTHLVLRDADSTLWHHAGTIAPGSEAALARGAGSAPPGTEAAVAISALGLLRPIRQPGPGEYVARLGARAFGAPGIAGGRPVGDGFNLVVGRHE